MLFVFSVALLWFVNYSFICFLFAVFWPWRFFLQFHALLSLFCLMSVSWKWVPLAFFHHWQLYFPFNYGRSFFVGSQSILDFFSPGSSDFCVFTEKSVTILMEFTCLLCVFSLKPFFVLFCFVLYIQHFTYYMTRWVSFMELTFVVSYSSYICIIAIFFLTLESLITDIIANIVSFIHSDCSFLIYSYNCKIWTFTVSHNLWISMYIWIIFTYLFTYIV